jgi:hypothetical protein
MCVCGVSAGVVSGFWAVCRVMCVVGVWDGVGGVGGCVMLV